MQKIGNFSKYVILIVLCTMSKTADALVKVKGEKYSKCKTASTNNDTLPMSMRSALECVQKCSQRKECFGVTTCRSSFPGESVQCWMSEAVLPEMCSSNISSLSAESCYYFQKLQQTEEGSEMMETTLSTGVTTPSTTEAETPGTIPIPTQSCQNGGTVTTNTSKPCRCRPQYGGQLCERYIRDCTEPYENGYTFPSDRGPYYLQPVSGGPPFVVLCDFRDGGVTHPFRRNITSDFNQNWSTCKAGFGDDPWSINDPCFFIGLDNLHRLLRQGVYDLDVHFWYHGGSGSIRYENFKLGPRDNSFPVTYNQFLNIGHTTGLANMFSTSEPVKFSANGNDVNRCFSQNNMTGWYGTDCGGQCLFSSGSCLYPVNGQATMTGVILFDLLRKSPIQEGGYQTPKHNG